MYELSVTGDTSVLKKRTRVRMNGIRQMIGPEGRARADAAIAAKVVEHPAYLDADEVFTYLSVGEEVDTREIIRDAWSRGKTVAVPRCVEGTNLMEWYRIDDFEGLEQGAYGIEEPAADPARLMEVPGPGTDVKAVAIVPGYSFDDKGYRLGYGGGYSDVFLPTFGGASVGLCRRQQWSEEPLNFDEHDVPVDYVVIG